MDKHLQESLDSWLDMWRDGIAHIGDVALFAERSIVAHSDVGLFLVLPDEIKAKVLSDLNDFDELKFRRMAASGSATVMDLTAEMVSLAHLMSSARLWKPD